MKKIKISKKVKKILNKNRRRKFIEEIRKDTKERICKNALSAEFFSFIRQFKW